MPSLPQGSCASKHTNLHNIVVCWVAIATQHSAYIEFSLLTRLLLCSFCCMNIPMYLYVDKIWSIQFSMPACRTFIIKLITLRGRWVIHSLGVSPSEHQLREILIVRRFKNILKYCTKILPQLQVMPCQMPCRPISISYFQSISLMEYFRFKEI